jgi:hypothetical protein
MKSCHREVKFSINVGQIKDPNKKELGQDWELVKILDKEYLLCINCYTGLQAFMEAELLPDTDIALKEIAKLDKEKSQKFLQPSSWWNKTADLIWVDDVISPMSGVQIVPGNYQIGIGTPVVNSPGAHTVENVTDAVRALATSYINDTGSTTNPSITVDSAGRMTEVASMGTDARELGRTHAESRDRIIANLLTEAIEDALDVITDTEERKV